MADRKIASRAPQRSTFLFRPKTFPAASAACCAAGALLLTAQVQAAEWRVVPRVAASETYTDNVGLAPAGLEQDELISQITPSISVRGTGARLRLTGDFSLQGLHYLNSGQTATNPLLSAFANTELIEQMVFLDARASVSQQNISLTGPQALDNTSRTNNRAEVRTYSISPYFRHHFGPYAFAESRLTHATTSTNAGNGISDTSSDSASFLLASGPSFRNFGWQLNYLKTKTRFEGFRDNEYETASGTLRYLVNPQLTLTATVGREKNNIISFGGARTDGNFYNAGFIWAPTTRTNVNATVGRRFYGPSKSLSLTHRTRLAVWQAIYSEDVTNSNLQFAPSALIPAADIILALNAANNPALAQLTAAERQAAIDAINSLLVAQGLPLQIDPRLNFLSNQVFLQKRFLASVGLNGARNTAFVTLFRQIRDSSAVGDRSSIFGSVDFATSSRIVQTGVSATLSHRIGPHTSANLSASYSRDEFSDSPVVSNQKVLRAGVSHQLQRKITGSVEYRRNQRDSNQTLGDYRENSVVGLLNVTF